MCHPCAIGAVARLWLKYPRVVLVIATRKFVLNASTMPPLISGYLTKDFTIAVMIVNQPAWIDSLSS
jgi:hypothetical protein